MGLGLRLRDLWDPAVDFTFGDLLDVVEHATPDMAIYRVNDPDYEWSLANQLQALLIDFHQQKAWAEGGKKGQRPKPIPRPGVSEKSEKKYTVKQKSTVTEMDEWLASRRCTA